MGSQWLVKAVIMLLFTGFMVALALSDIGGRDTSRWVVIAGAWLGGVSVFSRDTA